MYCILYFIAIILLVIGDGSRDIAISGLFITGAITQLSEVIYDGINKNEVTEEDKKDV